MGQVILNKTKIGENSKIEKIKMRDILVDFQTM